MERLRLLAAQRFQCKGSYSIIWVISSKEYITHQTLKENKKVPNADGMEWLRLRNVQCPQKKIWLCLSAIRTWIHKNAPETAKYLTRSKELVMPEIVNKCNGKILHDRTIKKCRLTETADNSFIHMNSKYGFIRTDQRLEESDSNY